MAENEDLARGLAADWRRRRPEARDARVEALARIFGGASRETWRFALRETLGGHEQLHRLILRRDPHASLIDTERRREFAAYRAFEDSDVPVPRTWWLEEDPAVLGGPFFVMDAIEGCEAAPMKLMQPPYLEHHEAIARQKWTILGRITRADPARLGGCVDEVDAAHAWRRELDHWSALVERDALEPQPVAQAAIRWLRRHPPPPTQRVSIVHGDYRTGNLLVAPDGTLRAVLDWEMVHLGDPLEDLGWSLNRCWSFGDRGLAGGIAPRSRAIEWWERASGLRADARALHWWELLACVKGQAIWLSAARTYLEGDGTDLMLAFASWLLMNSQDRAILELMGHLE
ncbi:MAG: phosphotransferase family protein [Burkholderiaceae bacterium]